MDEKEFRQRLIIAAVGGFCAAYTDYTVGRLIDEDEIADDAIGVADAVISLLNSEGASNV